VNVLRLFLAAAGLLLAHAASALDFGGLSDPFDWVGGSNTYDNYGGPYGGYGYPGVGGYGTGYPGLGGYGMDYPGGYPGLGGYGMDYPGGYPGLGGYGMDYPGGYSGLGGYGRGYSGNGGYGYPAYGGQVPGYSGYDSPSYGPSPEAQAAEIKRLKARIRRLEQAERPAPSTFNNTNGNSMQNFQGQPETRWQMPFTGAQPGYQGISRPVTGRPESPVYQPGYGVPPRYRFE